MTAPAAPLGQILQTYGIRRIDLAAAAGCDLKTLTKLERGRTRSVMVSTLVRVAHALGVAPVALVPELAARPPGRGLVGEARARQRGARGRPRPSPLRCGRPGYECRRLSPTGSGR